MASIHNYINGPQLIAVSASSNRSKDDQDPSTWKPPRFGVISGELELRTTCPEDGKLELIISHIGSTDVYTLPGKDYQLNDVRDHKVVQRMLATILE
ncbi:hypothetical protein [Exiguobacterium sp. RIT594]|uniref:hypothetical protein n=1 Tax=Exiguobacterium sp. RIT594 TaxID=2282449 RepID=UPI000DF84B15|nr:hypothetical protein [Exiguobacterium sp. RIT594]RDB33039.1 hypothetical protein DVG79_10975 [Exiguobacterium sp. RIT594]